MGVTLIIGGARSGKSRFAEQQARALARRPVYVATSRTWDADHAARIEKHRVDRVDTFCTIEEEKALSQVEAAGAVLLVDCVTLWLTNWFTDLDSQVTESLNAAQKEFDLAISRKDSTWIFVSNELGQGLHAETAVGRKFVDLQGFMNQYIAKYADNVIMMVAGLPLVVKGSLPADAMAPALAGDDLVSSSDLPGAI